MYSKFAFWEVHGQIYGQKFSFMGTCLWSPKTSISNHISKDVPPQMKIKYSYPHSNSLETFFLQKDSENTVCVCLRRVAASCIKLLASCIKPFDSQ